MQVFVGPRGPGFRRGFGPDAAQGCGDFLYRALQLLHGLAQVKSGLGPARPGRGAIEKGLGLALHLGPACPRDQGINLDQHRLGFGHRVGGHTSRPGERAVGIAPAQSAAGGVVGVIGSQHRVAGPQVLEEIACILPGIEVHERRGKEKAGLVALRCAWGHGRQRVGQLRRGGREIASAEKVGSGAGRSSGEERFQPALVEGNRGAGGRGNCFLAARLRRGSLFALGWFDGQGGAGQKKERESAARKLWRAHC